MDLPQIYKTPLLENPYPTWLKNTEGKQYRVLRLFAEACWARVGYQTQAYLPPQQVSWGSQIHGRPDLFDYYIEMRQQALQHGFFMLNETQLDELATLDIENPLLKSIRDDFLDRSLRHDVKKDEYGQDLPADLYDLLLTIEEAPPYRNQGHGAVVKRIKIAGKAYFAKLTEEVMSGNPPPGEDEFNEVSTQTALRALHSEIVPDETYHVVAADGQHCTVVAAIPSATTFGMKSHANAASYVPIACLQWIVLAEWLLGLADRHARNLLIQKGKGRAFIIDTAFSWRFHPYFLAWEEDMPFCHSFAYAMWEVHDPALIFARSILEEACERETKIFDALNLFEDFPHRDKIQHQFAILRDTLARYAGDIRLADN